MINKKIAISVFSILISLSLMGGATFAYFTDTATSGQNTLATGTLNVEIDQTAGIFQNTTPVTNWQPGEERQIRFDVTNDGTLPVYLRAAATGDWANTALDENLVKVTLVEFWNGSAWQTLASNPSGLTGFVYYSIGGLDSGLIELAGADREHFRLTVLLDPSANNSYQGQNFNAIITVQARQATVGATWTP